MLIKHLCPLATSQSHCLTILLKLSDELITLLYNIGILLVLVVRSVGFNDALSGHAVNGTWDTFRCDELGQIPVRVSIMKDPKKKATLPIQEIDRDTEIVGHAFKTNHTVALQQLLVSTETHLSDEPSTVFIKVAILCKEADLNGGQSSKE